MAVYLRDTLLVSQLNVIITDIVLIDLMLYGKEIEGKTVNICTNT